MNALTDIALDRAIGEDVRMIAAALADREKHLEAAAGCEKSCVLTAWRLGGRLLEKKKRLAHGDWLPWLESAGIGERSAQDYIRLATQIRSAADLGPSIRATLRTLPAPKATPAPQVQTAPSDTKASQASAGAASSDDTASTEPDPAPDSEPEPDATAALESALDQERATNEALREKLAIVEAQLDPDMVNQIDGFQAQLKTAKSQINSWQSKCADWQKRARSAERQLKAAQKRLDAIERGGQMATTGVH